MHILKRLSVLAVTFLTSVFAEDLIISGETMYLAGEHHFDNVIITNMGVLAIVEYGGSNDILVIPEVSNYLLL